LRITLNNRANELTLEASKGEREDRITEQITTVAAVSHSASVISS